MLNNLVHYTQIRYPGTVTLYYYDIFSSQQINALTTTKAPFAEKAITNWVFDRPVITVTKPVENKTIEVGELNSFKATAYDARNGDLSNDIVWWAVATDSSERIIGSGSKMHAILNLTDHQVVARVANTLGKNSAVTINVNVIPKL